MAVEEDLSTDQLADKLTTSRTHLSRLADSGALPTYTEAGIRRVRPADGAAFECQRDADRAELAQRFATTNRIATAIDALGLGDE